MEGLIGILRPVVSKNSQEQVRTVERWPGFIFLASSVTLDVRTACSFYVEILPQRKMMMWFCAFVMVSLSLRRILRCCSAGWWKSHFYSQQQGTVVRSTRLRHAHLCLADRSDSLSHQSPLPPQIHTNTVVPNQEKVATSFRFLEDHSDV
jgi:hypothetical protein